MGITTTLYWSPLILTLLNIWLWMIVVMILLAIGWFIHQLIKKVRKDEYLEAQDNWLLVVGIMCGIVLVVWFVLELLA